MSKKNLENDIQVEISRIEHMRNTFLITERLLKASTVKGSEAEQVVDAIMLVRYMAAETLKTLQKIRKDGSLEEAVAPEAPPVISAE